MAVQKLSDARRDVGVDVTRAVALVGMFCSHLTYPNGVLAEVLYGFPSALFAFVAGVSMAFMSASGARPAHFVVRGLVLIAMFFALSLVPTDIVIVLGTLGVCMIALAWAPPLDSRWMAVAAAVLTVISGLFPGFDYSPFMWAALMLAGMLFHRHVLGSRRREVWVAVAGLAVMAADIAARWYLPLPLFLSVDGHTGGVLDVVGSAGASAGICALCCLVSLGLPVAQPWQVVLPRMGRMPLTLYCLHVVTAAFIGIWATVAGAAVIAVVWLQFFPRGPVEEATRRIVGAGAGKYYELQKRQEVNDDQKTRGIGNGGGPARGAAGVGDGVGHLRG